MRRVYFCLQDLKNTVENGIEDEKVDSLLLKVKYAYEIKWNAYTRYRTCVNGFYAVSETGVWTSIEEDGTDSDFNMAVDFFLCWVITRKI